MGIAAASAGAAGPFRDYGLDGDADAATESAGAAVPFGDYGPAEATQRVTLDQHCYCTTAPLDWQTYNAGYTHMEIEALRSWLAVGSNDPY
jgi:hypothetical protein